MTELKRYLTLNSVFSAMCGILMLALASKFNAFFGIENAYVFPIIGGNLLVFAAFVWFVSKYQLNNKVLVNAIIVLDALWVLGSAGILLFSLFDLTRNGNILIGIVAVWIGFLGYKQFQHSK